MQVLKLKICSAKLLINNMIRFTSKDLCQNLTKLLTFLAIILRQSKTRHSWQVLLATMTSRTLSPRLLSFRNAKKRKLIFSLNAPMMRLILLSSHSLRLPFKIQNGISASLISVNLFCKWSYSNRAEFKAPSGGPSAEEIQMKEDVHVLTISGKVSTTKNKISKLANKRHRQSLILPIIILLTTHPQWKVIILLQRMTRRKRKLLFRSIKKFNSRQNKWTQVSQNLRSIKWICRLRIYPPL